MPEERMRFLGRMIKTRGNNAKAPSVTSLILHHFLAFKPIERCSKSCLRVFCFWIAKTQNTHSNPLKTPIHFAHSSSVSRKKKTVLSELYRAAAAWPKTKPIIHVSSTYGKYLSGYVVRFQYTNYQLYIL